jgi:hypothetical protein
VQLGGKSTKHADPPLPLGCHSTVPELLLLPLPQSPPLPFELPPVVDELDPGPAPVVPALLAVVSLTEEEPPVELLAVVGQGSPWAQVSAQTQSVGGASYQRQVGPLQLPPPQQ